MLEIITLFGCFNHCLEPTTLRQLARLVPALLAMTGRVTMRGIARWTDQGASYRTVQRFFNTVVPWGKLAWLFFRHHLWRSDEIYLLVGDESVVTKAGHATYGLDRFFSSIYNKPVPGLSFFTLSLVGAQEAISHPLLIEQVVREETMEQAANAKAAQDNKASKASKANKASKASKDKGTAAPKCRGGRPKGSKNKDKTKIAETPELSRLERMAKTLLGLIDGLFPLTYLVLDGHFGNNSVLQVVRQRLGLHLISKLRHDSALYLPYEGPQQPSGPRRRYGDKLDYKYYKSIPQAYRVACNEEKGMGTEIYQATLLHQHFAAPLNVVIIVKTNLQSGARAHAVLFSSDLSLCWENLVAYYRLRFQIEFNFRDAKQFWGLEDFMNQKQLPVTNAANLALFMVNLSHGQSFAWSIFRMVNLSHCLLREFRQGQSQAGQAGVLDLKAYWRGRRYAQATLKLLPQPPTPVLMEQIIQQVACHGAIHAQSYPFAAT